MANTAMGWIQDHSFGLSKVGVQKLSESVRAYVFLTLSLHSRQHDLQSLVKMEELLMPRVYGVHHLNSS